MARPTKYNKELLAKAQDYLVNYDQYGHPFPSLVGLARVLDVATSTVEKWRDDEDKPEFSGTLVKIKDEQHLKLLHGGIKGEFNAAITKLGLHNFGYSDKKEVEQSGVTVVKLKQDF